MATSTAHQQTDAKPPDLAVIRRVLSLLDETQWLDPDELRRRQFDRLLAVLQHARNRVPFYAERLAHFDLDQPLDEARWQTIPILTREALQSAGEAIRAQATDRQRLGWKTLITSGSTGRPVVVAGTPRTRLLWRALTLRDHLWHQREFAAKLAVIRYAKRGRAEPPHGITRRGWGEATDGLVKTGPGVMLSLSATTEQQARWLIEHNPGYLLSYASNLTALAEWFIAHNKRLSNLREVRSIGEIVTSPQRDTVRRAWNVPIVDVYTSQELGYIALQCPEHEHLHIQEENVLVEVVNDTDQPCQPGQVGRVLLTSLHNLATPLIRYDIGDYAEVGPPCPCGRGLAVLNRIIGRRRNMLILPDGQRRWPTIGHAADMAALPPVRQFQLVQKSIEHIEVRLAAKPFTPEQEAQAARYLDDTLGARFRYSFCYFDEIPRSKGGKFEDFRCEVPSKCHGSESTAAKNNARTGESP